MPLEEKTGWTTCFFFQRTNFTLCHVSRRVKGHASARRRRPWPLTRRKTWRTGVPVTFGSCQPLSPQGLWRRFLWPVALPYFTAPLEWATKRMDGLVSSGSAMDFTWRTILSLSWGPMAGLSREPSAILSMGPTSSTRIMQAMTQ